MIRTYDEEFVAKVKDYAALGLAPVQIANRLELVGDERRDFLFQITSKTSPLRQAYKEARSQLEEYMDAILTSMAVNGDVDALELESKMIKQREYDDLVNQLFGI